MNIEKYGYRPMDTADDDTLIPARITAVHRNKFEMICDMGKGLAHLKTREYYAGDNFYPTVGDFVLLDWQENGESRIIKTLERRTYFSRRDPSSSGHKEQAVAANFDYVFILQSLDSDFNLRRLERYLTLAWQSEAIPAVILTKADCTSDYSSQLRAAEKLAAGVGVFPVSAVTGYGLKDLEEYMKPGKTVVFLGSSGVGKSSLINALAGEELMISGDIREKDGRGRHTTTHRQLMMLKNGVMVIDTPGMRELGMWSVDEGIYKSFSDVEKFLGHCKFRDCRHQSEPGCGIKQAITNGELSQERFEAYQKLKEEARFADDKENYLYEKKQKFKEIAKYQRTRKQVDYRSEPCGESFTCQVCGSPVAPEDAGTRHRNHCPHCLSSIHVDNHPGDRASLCKGIMDPIGVWVRKNGEWAIIHRCRSCGILGSNRIAADDNQMLLMSIAMKPLAVPAFPLWNMKEEEVKEKNGLLEIDMQ